MAVDVRVGAVKIFNFAGVINEWLLNGRIIENRLSIWRFWFAHCMYQSCLRLTTFRFQIELLLLVYKLCSFLLLFWIQLYLRTYPNLHNVSNSRSLLYICYTYLPNIHHAQQKKICLKCFDAEKLHSKVQTSIFRLSVLIKEWHIF